MKRCIKYIVSVLSLLISLGINCQNLVINGSFELWENDTPSGIIITSDSPDYYKRRTRIYPAPLWDDSIPKFFPKRGFDGISYVGLHSTVATVESIAIPLSQQLEKNQNYIVRFAAQRLNLPSYSYSKAIEITLSDTILFDEPTGNGGFSSLDVKKFRSRVKNPLQTEIVRHKYGWDIFEVKYLAKGNEKYLIIYPPLPDSHEIIYYYLFDDFKVERDFNSTHLIEFEQGEHKFSNDQLQDVIGWMKQLPQNIDSIVIRGYADKIGAQEDNLDLSKRRTKNTKAKISSYLGDIDLVEYSFGEISYSGDLEIHHNRIVETKAYNSDKLESYDTISLEVITILYKAFYEDQRLRSIEKSDSINDKEIARIDSNNKLLLDKLFNEYGYLGVSLLNSEMQDYMGVMTLHQDLDFQLKHIAKIEEAVDNYECSPYIFAYLLDKIKVAQKEPQIFGSQLYFSEDDNRFKPYPISRKDNVNKKRKEYGLGNLEDYIKSFNQNK